MKAIRVYEYGSKPLPIELDSSLEPMRAKIPTSYFILLKTLIARQDKELMKNKEYGELLKNLADQNPELVFPAYTFQVPIGKIANRDDIVISASALLLVLFHYRAIDPVSVKNNLIQAIDSVLKNPELMSDYSDLFSDKDRDNLLSLSQALQKLNNEIDIAAFREIAQSVVSEDGDLIMKPTKALLKAADDLVVNREVASEVVEAMFEIMKAGYYPVSISGTMPYCCIAHNEKEGAYTIDFIIGETSLVNELPKNISGITGANNKIIPIYLDELKENKTLWDVLEGRYPGIKKIYEAVRMLLETGYYDTPKYKFSQMYFSNVSSDEGVPNDTEIESGRKAFLDYFSSFIFGHLLNLIDSVSGKHVYTVSRFVLDIGNIYIPALAEYNRPLVRLVTEGDAIKFDIETNITWYIGTPEIETIDDSEIDASYAVTNITNEGAIDTAIPVPVEMTEDIKIKEHVDIKTYVKQSDVSQASGYDYIIYDDKGEPVSLFNIEMVEGTKTIAKEKTE